MEIKVEDVLMRLEKHGVNMRIRDDGINFAHANIEMREYDVEELVLSFRNYLLALPSSVNEITLGPASVWDHFKQDYFPNFLLDIFPVKYNYINVDATAYFPCHKMIFSNEQLGKGFIKFRILPGLEIK